jgi:hypothetical protein
MISYSLFLDSATLPLHYFVSVSNLDPIHAAASVVFIDYITLPQHNNPLHIVCGTPVDISWVDFPYKDSVLPVLS